MSLIATNQDDAADTLGVDSRTFQRWLKRGCPGEPRYYVLRDCIQWARENIWSEEATLIEGATGEEGDIKTEYLRARIEKVNRETILSDFKIRAESDQWVEWDKAHAVLMRNAGIWRSAIERLERKFGKEAADMMFEALDEMEAIDFASTTT